MIDTPLRIKVELEDLMIYDYELDRHALLAAVHRQIERQVQDAVRESMGEKLHHFREHLSARMDILFHKLVDEWDEADDDFLASALLAPENV